MTTYPVNTSAPATPTASSVTSGTFIPSTSGAIILPGVGQLVDSSGNIWTMTSAGQPYFNGIPWPGGGWPNGYTWVLYYNGTIYANNAGSWSFFVPGTGLEFYSPGDPR